jgi:CBS-domain-containing membrane protein
VGVVCRCDLRRAGVATPIRSCMHRHPATADEQETAKIAAERMIKMRVGCLPVVDRSGTLRGMVTRRDLRRVGSIHAKDVRRCASCGSTHGLAEREDGAPVCFCLRCIEQAREPRSIADEAYFTLGGGD